MPQVLTWACWWFVPKSHCMPAPVLMACFLLGVFPVLLQLYRSSSLIKSHLSPLPISADDSPLGRCELNTLQWLMGELNLGFDASLLG